MMHPGHSKSRIIIEEVYPELNGGRFAAKRVVGDTLEVWADIFMDGHDLLLAEILYQQSCDEETWHQTSFVHQGNDRYRAEVPLTEVGYFKFTIKAWPDHIGTWRSNTEKLRAAGANIKLEIEEGLNLFQPLIARIKSRKESPSRQAETALNILSTAKGKELERYLLSDDAVEIFHSYDRPEDSVTYPHTLEIWVDRKLAEFGSWYEMFPRSQGKDEGKSSTFADCERRLPEVRAMGFDVLYLPPIHPIGLRHRKGKNNSLKALSSDPGSPYAIGSADGGHKAVHPELGSLKDFEHLVKTAASLGMEVALDFALQVSRDHPYLNEHPEWFNFRTDGSLKYAENPPKKYEDIATFNFSAGKPLWEELKSIVEFWIERGVTIFRVDNPHTKPFAFWEWLIKSIHRDRNDIIFLAEAFTRPKVMYLLAKAGFTQSYSYFTWRDTKAELTEYLTELTTGWPKDFFRPNFFPTTPDILPLYLQRSGRPGFIIRFALAATLGSTYGIYNGFELCEGLGLPGKEEFADSEKYEVKVRDWNKPGNIKDFITKLNAIRSANPALQQFTALHFYPSSNDQVIFYGKRNREASNWVFIAVNLDYSKPQETMIDLPLNEMGIDGGKPFELEDLLLGHSWSWTGARQHMRLVPETNPVSIFRVKRK